MPAIGYNVILALPVSTVITHHPQAVVFLKYAKRVQVIPELILAILKTSFSLMQMKPISSNC